MTASPSILSINKQSARLLIHPLRRQEGDFHSLIYLFVLKVLNIGNIGNIGSPKTRKYRWKYR